MADPSLTRRGPTVPNRLWSLSAVLRTRVVGASGESAVWFTADIDRAARWEMAGIVAHTLRELGAEFRLGPPRP